MSLEIAQKVIVPQKKNNVPQFLKQRDINSYSLLQFLLGQFWNWIRIRNRSLFWICIPHKLSDCTYTFHMLIRCTAYRETFLLKLFLHPYMYGFFYLRIKLIYIFHANSSFGIFIFFLDRVGYPYF